MPTTQLGDNNPDGVVAPGLHGEVVACGATTTLTADQSGSLVLLDTAAGSVLTLPAPAVGMTFDVLVTVTVTSNSHKVVTNSSSVFMLGGIGSFSPNVAEGGDTFAANGTTHVACTSNGTTTGGVVGQVLKLTAISATQWAVSGNLVGSGTLATPFATS
jgi:hypothetical protein